jgi:hypothetical protein
VIHFCDSIYFRLLNNCLTLEKLYCKQMTSKEFNEKSKEETTKALVDLINHIVDDPQISLKQKKLKLRALQRIHPDIYEKNFSDLQY